MSKIAMIFGGNYVFAEFLGKQSCNIVLLATNKLRVDNAVEELIKKMSCNRNTLCYH